VVGDGVGPGTGDLAKKEATKASAAFELPFLLVVHVEQIELAGAPRKFMGEPLEEPAQNRRAERIEEKEQDGALGKRKLDGIATGDPGGRKRSARRAPESQIAPGNLCQGRMEFDAKDLAKRHLCGQENTAAHARAHVDEGEVAKRRSGLSLTPMPDQPLKNRGGDTVVGCCMTIVSMTAL